MHGEPIGVSPGQHGADAAEADAAALLVRAERALLDDGDLRTGRRWFDAAHRAAERAGDLESMAAAALGLGGLWVHEHRSTAAAAEVGARQRRALTALDPTSPLALRLRARLAAEADYRRGGHAGIMGALDEARRAGDPVALAEALSLAHHCLLGPDHGALRRALAQELIDHSAPPQCRGHLVMGLLWQTVDLFLDADPHAERCLHQLLDLVRETDHLAAGFVASAIGVMLCIRAGRFEQAESMATACAERGAVAGDTDAPGWHGAQLVAIRWYQGRLGELLSLLGELVHSPTLSAVDNSYFAAVAAATATTGDERRAAGALARLHSYDLAALPRSSTWLVSMYGAVEAAHLLGDAELAGRAYPLLRPYERLPMIASLGVACFGSVHHALGVAALTMNDATLAVEHLRAAVRDNLALGHWPAAVVSRARLGQALARRAGRKDLAAARAELAVAAREAAEMGMALPPDPDVGPAIGIICRRDGRYWRIQSGARTAAVAHSVGMRHLAALLANPGQEIPAVDLAAGWVRPAPAESRQPVLDVRALRAYRERLAELEEVAGDQTPRDRAERDWLRSQLAAGTGLGGRPRPFAGDDERARIAVGKAIRRAIDRVAQVDPAIADQLRSTVYTGVRCSYRPGER
ncbi:hypothetical protein [Krasilnikovia sp. MM14-A1004]|uniref:hypothetical protein n=1 Tax=Krasilnikovia sp. MM14-A1004 TaxID=3373541 RepID=UPI00399D4355